ncbi:MAG: hypothetical protein ACTTIU_03885 [Treponema lecithinolyticum]|uniref:hypothetical protein n=1 Tax=Treponema lecithinolyticum TaxID=53418 RepID=UPI003FA29857
MSFSNQQFSSISIISAADIRTGSAAEAPALHEGDTVFVRVLSQQGKNRYAVSFAGQRFNVFSQRALPNGASFSAAVKIKDGSILLVPQNRTHTISNGANAVKHVSFMEADVSGRLNAFFEQALLPSDDISLRLLQFFQENGLRFNGRQAQKARAAALRFAGREKEAAEAALFLLEKGVQPDEQTLGELLDVLYGSSEQDGNTGDSAQEQDGQDRDGGSSDGKHSGHRRAPDGSEDDVDGSAGNAASAAPDNLLQKLSLLYENTDECLALPCGLLSFVNHYKTSCKHWILLPFDYDIGNKSFNGVIRLLLNTQEKKLEKIGISAFSPVKNYFFMVHLHRLHNLKINNLKKLQLSVNYCVTPEPPHAQRRKLDAFLKEGVFGNAGIADCKIDFVPDLYRTGSFTEMNGVFVAEAEV